MNFYSIIWIVFLFIVIFYNSSVKEGFTPGMRKLYRPYVRRARIATESFYDKNTTNANIFFRKLGIL
jgi:hypothetical protein